MHAKLPGIFLALLLSAAPVAAQWSVSDEESVMLEFGPANDKVFSVSCASASSDVVVVVPPGIKSAAKSVSLTVKEADTTRQLTLVSDVCGGETTCTDRGAGEVSTYGLQQKGKTLALAIADRAREFAIDAPGAKHVIKADSKVFARFAAMCRKKK